MKALTTPTDEAMRVLAVAGWSQAIRVTSDEGFYLVATKNHAAVVVQTLTSHRKPLDRWIETCATAISAGLETGFRVPSPSERAEIDHLSSSSPWVRAHVSIDGQPVEVEFARLLGGECAAFGSFRGIEFSIGTSGLQLGELEFEFVPRDALPCWTDGVPPTTS